MSLRTISTWLAVIASAFSALRAQDPSVVVLPRTGGPEAQASLLAAEPFRTVASTALAGGGFRVLATPSGSKYYIVTNQGREGLFSVTPGSFAVQRKLDPGGTILDAFLSPDGSRLSVLAGGTITVYNTSDDSVVNTILVGNSASSRPEGFTVSLDGNRAYAPLNIIRGVLAYNLTTGANIATIPLPFSGINGIETAPNGLIWVTAQARIYVIDPNTNSIEQTLTLSDTPANLIFSPDGSQALARVTDNPGVGGLLIDTQTYNVRTLPNIPGNDSIGDFRFRSNTQAFAIGRPSGTIYIADLNARTFDVFFTGNFPPGVVDSIDLSDELPTARYLFAISGRNAFRYDLSTFPFSGGVGPVPVPSTNNTLQYIAIPSTRPAARAYAASTSFTAAAGLEYPIISFYTLDDRGRVAPNAPVRIDVGSSGATIISADSTSNAQGLATFRLRAPITAGTFQVQAGPANGQGLVTFNLTVTGGVTDTQRGPLRIVAGNGFLVQENFPAAVFPRVQVRTNSGALQPNARVLFEIPADNAVRAALFFFNSADTDRQTGTCTFITDPYTAECFTDANGEVTVPIRASRPQAGTSIFQPVSFTATNGNNQVTFRGVVYPQQGDSTIAPTFSVFRPEFGARDLTATTGGVLPQAVQVVAVTPSGIRIPNIGIAVTSSDPSITVTCGAENLALTDEQGIATCDLVVGSTPGVTTLGLRIANLLDRNTDITLTVVSAAPSQVVPIQGTPQGGNPGATLASSLIAEVRDATGRGLSGQSVTWEVIGSSGVTLVNPSTVTDSQGRVSTQVRLGNIPGTYQVRAVAGSAQAIFTISVNAVTPQPTNVLRAESGGGQSISTNLPFANPLRVRVTNSATGAGVPGITVTFAATGAAVNLSANSAVTDAQGFAQTTVTAGAAAGTATVTATAGSQNVQFTLTIAQPSLTLAPQNFANAASFAQGLVTPGGLYTITTPGIAAGVTGVLTPGLQFGPLPQSLGGVTVRFNGFNAPILSVSNVNGVQQAVVQVPYEVPVGTANVELLVAGNRATANVPVTAAQPGIFETVTSTGQRRAVAIRLNGGDYIVPEIPARPGDQIRIFVTGLGQTGPIVTAKTGVPGAPNQIVTGTIVVGLNTGGVRLIQAKLAESLVGVYTVDFEVPADLTQFGANQRLDVVLQDGVSSYPAVGSVIALAAR